MAAAPNARTHNRVDCPSGEYAVGGGIAHAIGLAAEFAGDEARL